MRWTRVYWLLLLVLVLLGLARLRFDVEVLNLLPGNLSVAQGLKIYQQHFTAARELVVGLEARSAEEAEAAGRSLAQVLRAQTNLVSEVTWQPAWLESPAQAAELVAYLWLNQPPAVVGQWTNRLAPTHLDSLLAEVRERLATSFSFREIARRGYDPYGFMELPESVSEAAPEAMDAGEGLFTSPDGTFRLLFVEARPDLTDYRACREWLSAIQRLLADAQASGQLPAPARFHLTGRPAFVTEIAGGMENDMAGSAGGTLGIIGVLFWLTHRRLRPLFWLLLSLVMILAGTTALGGLFLGTVNVVSMGFAAILLGLAEDFGILVYQESRSHPELEAAELRREVAPGIIWSALTTAGAFLVLNLSTLPGLGQLGSLVALGIILAAAVMLFGYLPAVLRLRRPRDLESGPGARKERFLLFMPGRPFPPRVVWGATGLLLVASVVLLWQNGLRFDHSPNVLKPKNSAANAALEEIKSRFGRPREPLWVLVPGRDESEVGQRLVELNRVLSGAVSNGLIAGFTLPTGVWPQPDNQAANRETLRALVNRREALREGALRAGFTTDSLVLTGNILDCWQRALAGPGVFWPTNQASEWVLGKVAARLPGGFLALGFIHPTTNALATKRLLADWPAGLQRQGVILSAWELLGATVFETVVRELPRVLVPIFLLVVLVLWLAFRSGKEVVLSLVTLGFSGLLLGAAMPLLGWDWNILNLMALPLLLGLGVDFSIHIQAALRRHGGDRLAVRRSVGRALLLAGATTAAGFGSLAFSTNAGMASLGRVCALGITLALVTAVYLLPVWWKAWVESSE